MMIKKIYLMIVSLGIASVVLGSLHIYGVTKAETPLLYTSPGALYAYTEQEIYTPQKTVKLIIVNLGAYETNITLLYVVKLTPPAKVVQIIEPPENHLDPPNPETMQFDSMAINWDQKAMNGNRVPRGHYAFLIQYSGPPDWETLYALSSRFYTR